MSVASKFIGLLTGGFVKEVGEAIDRNVTSDEERLKLRNELAEIAERTDKNAQEYGKAIEENLTERHQADMKSDSKLAKNIRPATLIVLTVFTLLYMLVPVFKELSEYSALAYKASLSALIGLDMMVYGFYFGSRGLEKVADKIASALKTKKD